MSTPSSSRGSRSNTPAAALQRGKACLNCRRRKMRCDGVRPICGPCGNSGRGDDCEYADAQGRSRTQTLQDTISRLEARIHELENPQNALANVHLYHPQSQFSSSTSQLSSPIASSPGTSIVSGSTIIMGTDDLAPEVAALLLDNFFQCAGYLPWFLHERRFRDSCAQPPGGPNRTTPALLTTIYLWGLKFCNTEELTNRAPAILSKALSQIGHVLADGPTQVVQAIQAHTLLAAYLYHCGRFLEGRTHTDAAMMLAMHCKLHKIRSAQPAVARTAYVEPVTFPLPEPRDQIEEGERINAFWTVFVQDRIWAVILGVPTAMLDLDGSETQIDTPWPLEMDVYERGEIYPDLRTSGTLRNFFNGINTGWPWESNTTLTQLAKASALFERATRLAAAWRPELSNVNAYYGEFLAIDARIEELKTLLYPLPSLPSLPSDARARMYTVNCLVQAATVQLHAAFASQNAGSRAKCLDAGYAIMNAEMAANIHNFRFLDNGSGAIWAAVCRVLINEIVTLRTFNFNPALPPIPGKDIELREALDRMEATMTRFAPSSALVGYHLGLVRQERAVL